MSEAKCVLCVLCGKMFLTPVIQRGNYYCYLCYCPDCERQYQEDLR